MPEIHLARFVIERDPERDYEIVEAEGSRAQDLRKDAMALLDQLGHPRLEESDVLHGWLGPIGPERCYYVRVVVERLPAGEFRYCQWWFAADDLPPNPARCNKDTPDDMERIVALAKAAKEAAATRRAPVHPSVDPLLYCDGLVKAFGKVHGPRITWVTRTTSRPISVDLQFVADSRQDKPGRMTTVVDTQAISPRQTRPRRMEIPPTARKRPGWKLPRALLLVALLLGGIGGYVIREIMGDPSIPQGGGAPARPPEVSPAVPDIVPPIAAVQSDPAYDGLRAQVLSSYDAAKKLQDFLKQPGLAQDSGQTQIRDTVTMNHQLDFKPLMNARFSNVEVRKLLELLQALTSLHPSQHDEDRALPGTDVPSRQ